MGKYISYGDEGYKKRLADFMEMINPKPTEEQIEKLRQRYAEERNPKK
jgi:hypothetical protein